jgi:hypothetical protein
MRKIIIIFFAITILIGSGSFAVMQQLNIGPFAKIDTEDKIKTDPVYFVSMNPLVIPIIQGNSVAATIKLELKIKAKLEFKNKINREMTRLKDAYVRDLHSFFPRLMSDQTELDIDALKKRLKKISNRVLGAGVIISVEIDSASNI